MPKEMESTSSKSTVSFLDQLKAPTQSELSRKRCVHTPDPLLRESSDPLVAVTAIPSLGIMGKITAHNCKIISNKGIA